MKINRAQFWLGFLLYLFVMFDLTVTSIGLDRGVSEANTYLSVFITDTGSESLDGFILASGGLIVTGLMLYLAFLVSRIQIIFSFEFFIAMLVLFHFLGILNWVVILK